MKPAVWMNLSKRAKKHFVRQAPDFIATGTLTDGTLAEFIQLCKIQAMTDELADQVHNDKKFLWQLSKWIDPEGKHQISIKESEVSKTYRQYLKQQAELKRFFKFEPKPPTNTNKSKFEDMLD